MGNLDSMEPLTQTPLPENSAALRKRGNAHLQSGELAEAAECYRQAVAADPGDANAHVSLGFALRELQLFADAQAALRQAIVLDPDAADAHYLLGTLAVAHNAPDEAIGYFRQAIAVQPDLDVAYRDLFALLFRTGQVAEAKEVIARAIARWPRAADLRCYLGNLMRQQADHAAAADCYQEALAIAPDFPEAHNNLGCELEKMGKLDEAVASFKRAIALRPNYFDTFMNLGNVSVRLGRLVDAQSFYERAVASEPSRTAASSSLATVLQMQGRKQEAIASLRECVSRHPNDADILSKLGAALEGQGSFDEAIVHYRTALSIRPSVYAYLGLGGILLKQDNAREALLCYREVVRLEPGHAAGHIVAALSGAHAEHAPNQYVERLFDDYADKFDAELVEGLRYDVPNILLDVLVESAKPRPGQWTVLDLGCGTGLAGVAFATYARELVGVDLSAKMLAKAAARNVYHRLEKEDLLIAMQRECTSSYDLVIAADVFVYVGKLDELMVEARRLLRPGGLIGFSIENIEDSLDEHGRRVEPDFQLKHTVRYGHSPGYVRRLASANGFDIRHMSRVQVRTEQGQPVHGHVVVGARRD